MEFNKIAAFDLNTMVPNASILIIGEDSNDKNNLIQQLLYHYKNIPGGAVVSSEKRSEFYKHYFNNVYIHRESFSPNIILARQITLINKSQNSELDPRGFLLMDNYFSSSDAEKQGIIEILMNGRHYKLTYVLSIKMPLGITSDLRTNFDYVFIMGDFGITSKVKIHRDYVSHFHCFNDFEKIYDECIEQYGAMVVDVRKTTDNMYQRIFYFNTHLPEKQFMFGSETFRDLSVYDRPEHINETEYLFEYFINENALRSDK